MKRRFEEFFSRLREITPIKTQADLARELGVGRASISIAKNKDVVPSRWIFELSRRFGINPTYLIEGKGEPFLSGGEECILIKRMSPSLEIKEWGELKTYGSRWGRGEILWFEVRVKGMEPTLSRGDIALIEPCEEIETGEVYLLLYRGAPLLRRVERYGEKLLLISDNDRYPHLEVREGDVKIMGVVRHLIRSL